MTDRLRTILLIAVAVLMVCGMLWLRSCQAERKANAEADYQGRKADAAVKSGSDAVETLGNATAREDAIRGTVKDGTDEIGKAPAGNSNDAADRAVCRMPSYQDQPRCRALQ